MVVALEKNDLRKFDKLITDIKPAKLFDAMKFAGKISWEEDPLTYQKRVRNEWN